MDQLDARVAALKAAAATAAQKKVKAEQDRAVAQDRLEQARAALQAEFGVTTIEQAKEILEAFEVDLARQTTVAEEQLRKAGAQW